MRKESVHEWIGDNFDQLSDGDSTSGHLGGGCYRDDVVGDNPSSCELNVMRDGEYLIFNCLSASCPCAKDKHSRRGSVRVGNVDSGICKRDTAPTRRTTNTTDKASVIFKRSVAYLPRQALGYLERNNISARDALNNGIVWDELYGQIVIPVEEDGQQFGVAVRRIEDGSGRLPEQQGVNGQCSKWYNLIPEGAIYTRKGEGSTLFIVEAPTSAIVLNSKLGVHTASVFGTAFSEERVAKLRAFVKKHDINTLVFIPDPDVDYEKTRKLKKQLTLEISPCRLLRLDKKPRYEIDRLKEIF